MSENSEQNSELNSGEASLQPQEEPPPDQIYITPTVPVIKLQMKQPFKILIDIWGVITSWDFLQTLKEYTKNEMSYFIERHWDEYQIEDFLFRLREKTENDREINPDLPSILSSDDCNRDEVIKSMVNNIKWRETNQLNTFAKQINEFYQSILTEGYKTGNLLVHVFDDVVPVFKYWTSDDLGIKIYTYASGSVNKQRLFLRSTMAGDLNEYITNPFNSYHTYKSDPKKFHQIFSALLERNPQNILYLTDNPKKARAAIEANFRSVVVLRPGNKIYTDEELNGLVFIITLEDLEFLV